MGTVISNTANIQDSITNNLLNEVELSCTANCSSDISGNTIIIGGTAGDINLISQCTADASCSMSNSISSTAQNTIANMIDQENSTVTSFMGLFDPTRESDTVNIYNYMINNITQISSQTCNSTSSSTIDNNFIYVTASGTTGDINLLSTGNANASCTMSNISKIQTYNTVQSNVTQTNKVTSMMAMIAMSIIVLAIVGGIIFVLLFATVSVVGISKGGKSKSTNEPNSEDGTDLATEAATIKGLESVASEV